MSQAGSGHLAVIAGAGVLPGLLLRAWPDALLVKISGIAVEADATNTLAARFEQLGALFDNLKAAGISRVVFAGSMTRPKLDERAFDAVTRALAPRIMAAMAGGDDGLLQLVIKLFEDQGFVVSGAHDLLPELTARAGYLTAAQPSASDRQDGERGKQLLATLGPADVSQACVFAGGLCLGIESIQGTDAMLGFVADTRAGLRPETGGVLVKRAKSGQDLRADMPAIGQQTVAAVLRAGLSGICIQAGQVIVLDRAQVLAEADAANIAIWAVS
ncbi:MAG: LpxI family protein [Halocynthiibacter sp.]